MKNELRPNTLSDFKGQKKLKKTLAVLLESAKKRRKTIDHILLYGKPGLGKTSLATILALESGSKIHYSQGPLLEKKSDIITLFGNLTKGDFVFIDEIHGINKNIEELLYSIMEDYVIDITVGPEGDQRIVRIKLPNFTLIGATTKLGKISRPLKDRFGLIGKFMDYEDEEIAEILLRSSKVLKKKLNVKEALQLSKYAKGNPRIANNLLKRVIDFSIVENRNINDELITFTLKHIGLFKFGLNELHIQYLKILNDVFDGKYVSIETISGILQEDKFTIENELEIDLLKNNLIIKSSRGRAITSVGSEYITNILAKGS